ncbi:MAG: tRNA (adenosine(37)-N6)-threonylcarbamoyltransferase complex ATPase subunit type 1 TsaE [Chloroflexi bacterium AL-W]|nr:tRNA (adenosine(37)-N6)-threonylcarbamoyltransferase complex ATPase subunit type 1 TsaE [Chloroflexi bacterium AL-N1]NOK70263.1 tRNA (adenosine(37)-N6)-threonylcarbamoyltransferase complex ATPase subunit type 1 TsaE [Chloroflexi bacterium AL-N10]NOK77800.1 tRNA (adenosine(37)-N6)-threonylcarbamoyltransferase complex ATPase subunit type 1 TsaE [Chloroflexi bacterium AL-N5]NOK84809.1 tRNA (adenosine(37)-N6)-threonylcarbamoyltransferase complex ATPase subunit type 1 TsaE [Chloroflexi bacterium A
MNTQLSRLVQSPHVLDCISHSAIQTVRIGQRLGELLQSGDVVLLHGELGTGKTQITKGIAQGLGSGDMVNSPSFVLMNEYRAGPQWHHMPIYHVDLYRIETSDELYGIGLTEALIDGGVCLVEWAERALDWFENDRLEIHFSHLSETKRIVRFIPYGTKYESLIHTLKNTAFA